MLNPNYHLYIDHNGLKGVYFDKNPKLVWYVWQNKHDVTALLPTHSTLRCEKMVSIENVKIEFFKRSL